MDDVPVGVLTGAGASQVMRYIETDQLGTPRAIIDPTQQKAVWRWDESKEGFGSSNPDTDPDGNAVQFVFDLRFSGQRYDMASGLYYNYMRDYDPVTGRYTQSDPAGLLGGISTYAYVGNDPLMDTDPYGLFGWRDAAGFVPVLGSALDAYDAYKCGNYGMMALNIGLALTDLTGTGAIIKGLTVGTMKFASRKAIKQVFKESANWNQMRRGLQDIGEVARNSWDTLNRDWLTTDHILIKRKFGLPHWITNAPWNLQTNVPKWLNSSFEHMHPLERMMYLPTWMKTGGAGILSTASGWFVGSGGKEEGGGCACQ